MKNLSIAVLAALSIMSFAGCKKKGGAGDAIAKMTEFKDQMCKCADKACAEKVTEGMTKWGQEMAKEAADKDSKLSEEDTKKMAAATEEMTKCMTKAMMAGGAMTPPPAAAAAPAGDKPADPAAPAAPAGDKPADPAAPAAPAGDKPAAGSN
jgi:glycerol dehydrogenase-like iron-containing ADH family enzyme